MRKVRLTIGHNVGTVPVFDTMAVCAAVTTTLAVSAFTAIPCYGMWQGQPEQSTRVEIVTTDDDVERIVSLVPALAGQLNQEAITCEVSDANVSFTTSLVTA